jgi:hypothetical protein
LGTWENVNPNAGEGFFKFLVVERLALPGYPPEALKVTAKFYEADKPPRVGVLFSKELNRKKFVCQCGEFMDDPKEMPDWGKLRAKGYGTYKYQISANSLTVWSEDRPALENAVMAGKLKGKLVGSGFSQHIQLSDTSADLAKFLSSEEGDAVFGKLADFKRAR